MDLQTARGFWQGVLYVGIGLSVVSGVLIFLGTWRGYAIARRIETEAPFQQPLAQATAKVILRGATLYEIDAPARIANKGGSLIAWRTG